MKLILEAVDKTKYSFEQVLELDFTQTVGVPCDSISVRLKNADMPKEIAGVKLCFNEEIVFNGYCDNQKVSCGDDGFETYIYARSGAAVLVDNEAEPFTYNMPIAKQLCYVFAKPLGFTDDLPVIESREKYEIQKGTTCYGAISGFVAMAAGKNICVMPDNCIKILEKSDDIKELPSHRLINACAVINRSEPLTEIRFKKDSALAGYKTRMRSSVNETYGLTERIKYVNLSSLPQWQRDNTILQTLKNSYEDYRMLEVTVAGYVSEPLLQRYSYHSRLGDYEDYVMTEKEYIVGANGEFTRLVLKKEIDIKEITYVAQ